MVNGINALFFKKNKGRFKEGLFGKKKEYFPLFFTYKSLG